MPLKQQTDHCPGNPARNRYRQKPGPDDSFDDRQLERVRILRETDAHDRRGNAVGGGNRHAEMGGGQ